MTIYDVISYQFDQESQKIRDLKLKAITPGPDQVGYRYFSPDGTQSLPYNGKCPTGWTYKRGTFHSMRSISPLHESWGEYRRLKKTATMLVAAKLLLKRNDLTVPEKTDIGTLVMVGTVRSQARTFRQQKSLAFKAHRWLKKQEKHLEKNRFPQVNEWLNARQQERNAA